MDATGIALEGLQWGNWPEADIFHKAEALLEPRSVTLKSLVKFYSYMLKNKVSRNLGNGNVKAVNALHS